MRRAFCALKKALLYLVNHYSLTVQSVEVYYFVLSAVVCWSFWIKKYINVLIFVLLYQVGLRNSSQYYWKCKMQTYIFGNQRHRTDLILIDIIVITVIIIIIIVIINNKI